MNASAHAAPEASAGLDVSALRTWVLTDGKAGDEQPLIGVAEAMGTPFELRRVKPRLAWVMFMPYGPVDPRESVGLPAGPLAPPFPNICLATGRRAVAYARELRRQTGCMTVFFKDPRVAPSFADLVFVIDESSLGGSNVISTLTGPNRITERKLEVHRKNPGPLVAGLSGPRAAVLIGGNTRRYSYTRRDRDRMIEHLQAVSESGVSLMITASRRTPGMLVEALRRLATRPNVVLWDGSGDNPYFDFLANADHVIVTTDSSNMIGEAVASGRPVHFFTPEKQGAHFSKMMKEMADRGAARPLAGNLSGSAYAPINSTPFIAQTILEHFQARGKARRGQTGADDAL
ncbi:MAG: mitochondrial fission ELM1 family protein [Mesorhizobium sp.]